MTKDISEIINPATKVEEMFDLLKKGFFVDHNGLKIIARINKKQTTNDKGRIIKEDKYRGYNLKPNYTEDYSVFYALIFSYPMNKLSQTTDFFELNSLYESFSKIAIEGHTTYLRKSLGLHRFNSTEEERNLLSPLYKRHREELGEIQSAIMKQNSYEQWVKTLKPEYEKYIHEMRLAYEICHNYGWDKTGKFKSDFYHILSATSQGALEAFDKKAPGFRQGTSLLSF